MAQKFYQFRELCEENLVGTTAITPSSTAPGEELFKPSPAKANYVSIKSRLSSFT
jgi:hypothetical protein